MSKRCMGCMEVFDDELDVCPYCGYIVGSEPVEAVHMEPGTVLNDRYIVGKALGYGSFGVTYIAWDGKLEIKVAIKEYMPSEFSSRSPGRSFLNVFEGNKREQFNDGLAKFVEEAKRLAKFQNEPGIVRVYDTFAGNGTAYIVMELLEGETLGERLKKTEHTVKYGKGKKEIKVTDPIPEDEAVKLLTPVMESLKVVHKEGIIHRDIAPDNIFLTKTGETKLIDFGAARYATTSHSRSLTTIVKPGYSPREQYDSRGDQGPHTDVYALATTLYKMVTGKTPPEAMGRYAVCEAKRRDPLIEPHKLVKNISENRENAILNAMNVRIEDRTPNIESFMNELEADPPVKRRYGNIKHVDRYHWPLWLKILVPVILAGLVTLGALLATGVIDFPSLFSDEVKIPEGMTIVPDVEEIDKDEALKRIEDAKLLASPEGNVVSDHVEAGKIVLQSPWGGMYLEENGTVKLVVSSGKGVVAASDGISTVPYVIWDTQEDAIAKLKQAGLADPIIETKSDENVGAGKVISQSEEAGKQVAEGTQITIVVSTGPTAFEMPSVTDKPEKTAKETLTARGLVVSINYEKNDNVKEGNVISQSVKAGTKVKSGDKVTLTVSSGKPLVNVPNVVGKNQTTAKSELEKAGFAVKVFENYDSNVASGNVISQSPEAGSSQIKGSTVILYVSKGKPVYTVADVIGKPENTARGALTHFTVEVKYGGYSSSVPYGSVLEQSPAGGTSLTEDSKVVLTLSKGSDWSGWSETKPDESIYEVKTEVRYRYRDKETTTSSKASLGDGWTRDDSKTETKWSGWSNWQRDYVSDTNDRKVESRYIDPTYKTVYKYFHYCCKGEYGVANVAYGNKQTKHYATFDSMLTNYHWSNVGAKFKIYDTNYACEYGLTSWMPGTSYKDSSPTVETVKVTDGYTEYHYKTASYTYHYYKWSSWTDWSTTKPEAKENREIDAPKTYYSYRRK